MKMECVVKSFRFFEMHKLHVEYETSDNVLSTQKLRKGLAQFFAPAALYERPLSSVNLPMGGNNAIQNGTGTASFPKGQILTTIKLLCRLEQKENDVESPIFFYAHRNYDNKLSILREQIREELMAIKENKTFDITSIMEVPVGGLFVRKSDCLRVRITKVNLDTLTVEFWAIDEAFFGNCRPSDLTFFNTDLAALDMLAIPGVFEKDPPPAKLQKFEDKSFSMARITHPKYSFDFGPRKIILI